MRAIILVLSLLLTACQSATNSDIISGGNGIDVLGSNTADDRIND